MILLDILAWVVCLPVALLSAVFVLEIFFGLAKRRETVPAGPANATATAVLIPAHNEELGIGVTLERLRAQLGPNMRVLVVADNCTDRTAEIARAAGAETIERHNIEERGKGYALAFGRDHLALDPPDTVIVLDADCQTDAASLSLLAATVAASGDPAQAGNLLKPDRGLPAMVQVSNFGHAVKNIIRETGARRLGAPNMLTGTGMAFPWSLFATLPLASGSLAEDLELGIKLARQRRELRLVTSAQVWSAASNASATLVQRSRWEGGYLAMTRRHALPLLIEGLASLRWPLFALGLHLSVPPLALLVFLDAFALGLLLVLAILGATPWPLALIALLFVALTGGLVAAWLRVGRPYLSPGTALRLPLYALWKIPMYLKLLRGGDKQWIRSERS